MLDKKDIIISRYSNSSSEEEITITHIPTGLNVQGKGIFIAMLVEDLMKRLELKIKNLKD